MSAMEVFDASGGIVYHPSVNAIGGAASFLDINERERGVPLLIIDVREGAVSLVSIDATGEAVISFGHAIFALILFAMTATPTGNSLPLLRRPHGRGVP